MSIFSAAHAIVAQAAPPAGESSMAIDLAVWKWVIIIGASAVIILYTVKRIAEVFVRKKTDSVIRQVVGEESPREEGLEDLNKLNEELDSKDPK